MIGENKTSEERRALSVLGLTQNAFDEIRLLYAVFERNPFDGLDLLRDDPKRTQYLNSEYDRLERLRLNPQEGPGKIVFLEVARVPDEPTPNSGDDVRRWLYMNRIKNVLQEKLIPFRDELRQASNEVEKDNRTLALQSFLKTLVNLSAQLSAFKGKTADNFSELSSEATANWQEIYERLNGFIFSVQQTVEQYADETKPYLQSRQPDDLVAPITLTPLLNDEQSKIDDGVTQASLALFYYYCHEKKCLLPFPAGRMQQAYQEATHPYGLSWKPFQQHYNRFSKNRSERMAEGNRKALMKAIDMLEEHPNALELAKDELKTAETRKPLT